MNDLELLLRNADSIESRLGYHFQNRSLLGLAFIHRSYVNENRNVTQHNERLEFLGDSILGLLMAEYLYCNLPDIPEGELSYLRSRLVESSSCVSYIQKLGIGNYVLVGRGERMNDGRGRDTILADLFEAIIGAIYLDGGLAAAKHFIFNNFKNEIESTIKTPLRNWKAMLQDYCQKKFQQTPIYHVVSETGPDHSKQFTISVLINNQEFGKGSGSSKKAAQQEAAKNTLEHLIPKEID